MVYYFTSTAADPAATIFVGKDKVENEELIKYGWDEDVWYFHADNLSSAHIYLRLAEGQTWDALPPALLEDCAQLTKANSIEGNKRDNVTIIYTPWSNLKKDGGMAVGQVGFHNPKLTARIHVPTRQNPTINRLVKTRTEVPPPASSAHLRDARDAQRAAQRAAANKARAAAHQAATRLAKDRRAAKEQGTREWEELVGEGRVESEGRSNQVGWDEEDFM